MKKNQNNSFPDDSILVRNARLAVSLELKKKRALKQPIAKYDPKTKTVYMIEGDGTISVLNCKQ